MIATRVGGIIDTPLLPDRLSVRALVRGRHSNRAPDERRYEIGSVLLRVTGSVRVCARIWPSTGVDDVVNHPGPWFVLRAELLDNDLRNLTSMSGSVR